MPDPPRRRRSAPSRRSSSATGSNIVPTIVLGLGVVVVGLGIGAFLSALQHKGSTRTTSTTTFARGVPVVTPVARPSRGPVAVATLVAHPTPTATPSPTAAPKPTPHPTAAATTRPKPTATPRPRATATPAATPAAAATSSAALAAATPAPATPAPVRRRTPPPVVITPAPAQTPLVITPPPHRAPASQRVAQAAPATGMRGEAEATVRRYITALVHGNESAAYAALGASPGDPNARLSEEAFVDPGTRIVSMRTNAADASGATVEVELSSSRGTYFATYHVRSGPNGPVIDQHDYIRE